MLLVSMQGVEVESSRTLQLSAQISRLGGWDVERTSTHMSRSLVQFVGCVLEMCM